MKLVDIVIKAADRIILLYSILYDNLIEPK